MNTEDFVTYAQAVKLKECGFDWPCYEFWDNSFCLDGTPVKIRKSISEPKICVMSECNSMLDKMGCGLITAPSLSQAAKWLREVKGIYIEVKVRDHNAFETVGKVIDNKTPHLPLQNTCLTCGIIGIHIPPTNPPCPQGLTLRWS